MVMSEEYHGFPIDYNEGTERFRAFVDGSVAFENTSLRGLKLQIDGFEKAQSRKDFKRFKVLVYKTRGWNSPKDTVDKYIEGEVTSITEGGEYWISVGGNRSKESSIIPITLTNQQITSKIESLRREELRIYNERQELEKSIERLSHGARPDAKTN